MPYFTGHVPPEQLAAIAQTFPHAPQSFLSFWRLAHAPSVTHAVRPPLHVKLQLPSGTCVAIH